jgi:hypothetical protein
MADHGMDAVYGENDSQRHLAILDFVGAQAKCRAALRALRTALADTEDRSAEHALDETEAEYRAALRTALADADGESVS